MSYCCMFKQIEKTLTRNLLLVGLLVSLVLANSPISWILAEATDDTTLENQEVIEYALATFAGGCFWGVECTFERVEGVAEAISGYTGGYVENPTYYQVCSGTTGHYEAVQVYYDPEEVTFRELLDTYWGHINPIDPDGQYADKGSQYRTVIFYHNEEHKRIAEESKRELDESGKFDSPIVTEILPLYKFYPAEEYHQDYFNCGPEDNIPEFPSWTILPIFLIIAIIAVGYRKKLTKHS